MANVIDPMWAIITKDPLGGDDEGIPAILSPDGTWVPLVGADPERVGWMKEQAQNLSTESGLEMKLVCFQDRIELETFTP